MESFLDEKVSRSRFLKLTLKMVALTAIFSPQLSCSRDSIPKLKGLSSDNYLAFRSLQEVFLEGNPLENFDLGIAADNYAYGHPYPIETESTLLLLAFLPTSVLVSLFLDFSFKPLASLDKAAREERLLSWKNSSMKLKRGAYTIMRQISFFLVSMDKDYQKLIGYEA
ncbi:hypothetical protein CH373_00535 [Leptospira perolatii]|uniref:Uncharacterized protein n=1 Tax=Leptospira perolatii TaxID=2023191 RepID=A0A2M9ZSX9_9LEPT|nr:hypothetical protein [Leptospira perolatii]PJZ71549.1 hypothetical protein CH360_00535 [Leptospira perolatii]PJZ75166.1 hypothetical protein CH373_00535 [Leptospira perolatii]